MEFINIFSTFLNRKKSIALGIFLNNERTLLSLCVTLRLKLKQCGHVNITNILQY